MEKRNLTYVKEIATAATIEKKAVAEGRNVVALETEYQYMRAKMLILLYYGGRYSR